MRSASPIVCWRDHWKPPSAREWPQAAFAGGIGDGRRSRPTTGPCDQHIQRSNTHSGAPALDDLAEATSTRSTRISCGATAWAWRSLELDQQPLALSSATFGELVHELLRRTINSLEPAPGFGRASRAEIEVALEAAVDVVSDAWPLERAVPPSASLASHPRRGSPQNFARSHPRRCLPSRNPQLDRVVVRAT